VRVSSPVQRDAARPRLRTGWNQHPASAARRLPGGSGFGQRDEALVTTRRLASLLAGTLLMAAAVDSAIAVDNLGRLFFTPQQRQDLDRRRQANIQESTATVNSFVTVNGQVSRSNGKNTVWVNGVPQETSRKPADPSRVTVQGAEGEPSINLKIGQSFDRARGQLKDPARDGNMSPPAVRDRGER